MRFITKLSSQKTEKLSSDATKERIVHIAKNIDKGSISDSIYRDNYNDEDDNKRSRVADQLALSYLHKCAYCESLSKPDIEHYRPKKSVSDDPVHNGYYWLCYEWTNLIPACVKCNRDGAKGTHFPVLGNRVYLPSFDEDDNLIFEESLVSNDPLLAERPYLLHPEVDDPTIYFEFYTHTDGIKIRGIDVDGRGAKTIEICLLNRQILCIERKQNVILEFTNAARALFEKLRNGMAHSVFLDRLDFLIDELFRKRDEVEHTHTLLRDYILRSEANFRALMLPFLPNDSREIVVQAYLKFLR